MNRERNDPTNTNYVPVLDAAGRPLIPTRPSRARRLTRQDRAEKHWVKGVFTIQMRNVNTDNDNTVVDGVDLNIDPGASATGLAITSETPEKRRVHALIELRHRGNRVRNKLDRRRSLRRNRRGRLRHRPPRFDNRTRPEGWLPPSLTSRLANTLTYVNRLNALYPIRHVRVETAVLDTQLMQDAEIAGVQYQEGNLLRWQLRSYVFHRDRRKCAYCSSTRKDRYELDHIVPKTHGGADRVSNLVVACRECNAEKSNTSVAIFLADKPARLAAIRRIQRSPLSGAAHLNVILPELLRRLEATGFSVSAHDSYTTSYTRRRLGLSKTHANDALCLGQPHSLGLLPHHTLVIQATGHGDRQMLRPLNRHGNPRGRGYRDYCALPRQKQGYTNCPGHRDPRRRLDGIASGDLVRFSHPKHGVLTGHGALDKRKNRVSLIHNGMPVSVRTKSTRLLARNHGYRITAKQESRQELDVQNEGVNVQP